MSRPAQCPYYTTFYFRLQDSVAQTAGKFPPYNGSAEPLQEARY